MFVSILLMARTTKAMEVIASVPFDLALQPYNTSTLLSGMRIFMYKLEFRFFVLHSADFQGF